jgi:hypothetical protein
VLFGIDPVNQLLYGHRSQAYDNDLISKFDTTTMSLISEIETSGASNGYSAGGIDLDNNVLYYSGNYYYDATEYVQKVFLSDLSSIKNDPRFPSNMWHYNCAAYHNGYAYFGTGQTYYPQEILKVDSNLNKIAVLSIDAPGNVQEFYAGFEIDHTRNLLYALSFGNDTYGGLLFKIDLATFTVQSYVLFNPYSNPTSGCALGLAIDTVNQVAYCIDDNWEYSNVIAINTATMEVAATLTLPGKGQGDKGSAIDVANGFVILSTFGDSYTGVPARIWKIGLYSTSLPISSIYHKWHEPVVII